MIDAKPLPDRPSGAVDADEWTLHHRVFYRLVLGAPGISTEDLQLLYESIGPVAYKNNLKTPIKSKWHRRKVLNELRDAGLVDYHPTQRGRLWAPDEDVVDVPNPGEELND